MIWINDSLVSKQFYKWNGVLMIIALIISFSIVEQKKQGNSEKRSFFELALAKKYLHLIIIDDR